MTITEQEKLNEVLRRSIPVTRMIDYGMLRVEAETVHTETIDGADWVEALIRIVDRNEAAALRAESDSRMASAFWHRAAMGLVFAQMVDNFDTPRKVRLYRRMVHNFKHFVRHCDIPISKVEVPYQNKSMFGWHFHANHYPQAAVVIFGGLSGWATAYRASANALCLRGIDCLLVDLPGQGETRIESGLYADASIISAVSRFFDYLDRQTVRALGIWGNSFGGLFAALTAAADKRIRACCINGAPPHCEPPPFRTPSEQMAALFGRPNLTNMASEFEALRFDPQTLRITCPVLVLEGGADPLAAPGTQDVFLSGNPQSQKVTWDDGEHTIYNYATERDELVSNWFADVLFAFR